MTTPRVVLIAFESAQILDITGAAGGVLHHLPVRARRRLPAFRGQVSGGMVASSKGLSFSTIDLPRAIGELGGATLRTISRLCRVTRR